MPSILLSLSIPALVVIYFFFQRRLKYRAPLPPGPKGLPILGDVISAIRTKKVDDLGAPQWAYYLDLGKKYQSDVVHINVLGDHTVVLNSVKATNELLEKRSALYSGRPHLPMINDLIGWDWNFGTMPYTNQWRLHRRAFHQEFGPQAVTAYRPVILQSTSTLLKSLVPATSDLSKVPNMPHKDLEHYVHNHAGSIILRIVYGMTTQGELDDYAKMAALAAQSMNESMNHGAFFVDYFPILKHIPAWVPGATFKKKARDWKPTVLNLVNRPWEKVKNAFESGTAVPCIATKHLERISAGDYGELSKAAEQEGESMEDVYRSTSGVAYFAASDTTVSLVMTAIVVLSRNPDVQAKVHKELDSVVGPSRLPDFNDREDLPYLEAILKEVQRSYPVSPIGNTHCATTDDIYDGYFIPKGTSVIGNIWAILHDPEYYPDPLKFNPDRFMPTGPGAKVPPNPELYAFGFGRRICPGKHLALEAAWLALACLLATCDISTTNDADLKKQVHHISDFTIGLTVHPKPYNCRIVPRSAAAINLMKNGFPSEDL
ncbi:cytochrome P450 [Dendrothele bispora CBS 962.96]|uniref:Cytochrome P450 n=1 Tax=Dendrothele bispora (strain CBS 962.96) TaxID=1314807 RepID=A0A4S8LRD7_DENBC|nr:cytochrome P450 [Dendrothele bispora CBS 962.96]